MDLRPGPHFVPLSGRPHLIFLMVRHLPPLFYDKNQDLTSESVLGVDDPGGMRRSIGPPLNHHR